MGEGVEIEPRTILWAVAEVSWEDGSGTSHRAPATLEDTSSSGACIRVKRRFTLGSRITIKWHREQFSAVARNCRSDGRDFLLGLRREAPNSRTQPGVPSNRSLPLQMSHSQPAQPVSPGTQDLPPAWPLKNQKPPTMRDSVPNKVAAQLPDIPVPARVVDPREYRGIRQSHACQSSARPSQLQNQGSSPGHERKVMTSKTFFPKLWRRPLGGDAPDNATHKEASVNKPNAPAEEPLRGTRGDLLSYDDIYHAAGILGPRSGYSIHKVVEMLNSDRIRELPPEVKRASVLMALDAAGASVEDLRQDATRRQQALDSYEEARRKQAEEFEALKAQENAQIQAELDRLTAHYAERLQQNQDQVAQEKETLHNWQMAKQHESQRINEVMELCARQSPATSSNDAARQPGGPAGKSADGSARVRPNTLAQTAGGS
jgi:hypothetical protein